MFAPLALSVALVCGYSGYYSYQGEDAPVSRNVCYVGGALIAPASFAYWAVSAKLASLAQVGYATFTGATLGSCVYSYQHPDSSAAKLMCTNGIGALAHVASDVVIEPAVYGALGYSTATATSTIVARGFSVRGIIRPLVRSGVAASAMYLSDYNNTHSVVQAEAGARGFLRYLFKTNKHLGGSDYRLNSFLGGVAMPLIKAVNNGTVVADSPFIGFKGLREIGSSFIPLPGAETYSAGWFFLEFSGNVVADLIEPSLRAKPAVADINFGENQTSEDELEEEL